MADETTRGDQQEIAKVETLSWDNQAILEMFRKSGIRPGHNTGLTARRARWCLIRIWNLRPTKKICVARQGGRCAHCDEKLGKSGIHCHHAKITVAQLRDDLSLPLHEALAAYLDPANCEAVCEKCHRKLKHRKAEEKLL